MEKMVAPLAVPAVGTEIPTFVRETGLAVWNRYAAVNNEFVPIHMDAHAGVEAGMAGAFGMGNLQWAYLHNVIRDWMGDRGSVVDMACQFRGINLAGEVTAHGRVESIEEATEGDLVALEVWTENAEGHRLATGRCSVRLNP